MPAKRATVASPARPAKAAKRSAEPWQPALDMVAKSSKTLNVSCVSMLNTAIPHIFAVPKEQRHSYHTSIIESLTKLGEEEHERLRAAMTATEADLQSLEAEQRDFSANYEQLQADVLAKATEKDAKEAESNKRQEVAASAAKTKEEQDAKVLAAEMDVKAASEKKEAYEEKMAHWETLKACGFARKDWRARNKAISVIVGCLKEASAPQSLQASLSAALSGGPERSPFAALAIEHSEKAMSDHIAAIVAEREKLETVVSEHKQAVEASKRDAQAAQQEADRAMQVAIDAANTWVDAASKVTELEKSKVAFATNETSFKVEIARQKEALEAFASIREKVQALVDGAAVAEETSAEVEQAPGLVTNEDVVSDQAQPAESAMEDLAIAQE